MIPPLLRSGYRYLERHLVFTSLSIAGLVTGLTASILIFLWTTHELSFDQQYSDNDRVFLVLSREQRLDGSFVNSETTPAPLSEYLRTTLPEVEHTARQGYGETKLFSSSETEAYGFGHGTDRTFFDVFHYKFIEGDPKHLLDDNNSIVISETMAKRLFKARPVVGKVITMDQGPALKITGVFEDQPRNSSLDDEYLWPINPHLGTEGEAWDYGTVYTYVKLREGVTKEDFDKRLIGVAPERAQAVKSELFTFAFTDWHLRWAEVVFDQSTARADYVVAFSLAGAFILVMACVNFMNLATARAAARAKEVGVRKMSGATISVLRKQFLLESMSITLFSGLLSLILVYALLPLFNVIVESHIPFNFFDPMISGGILLIVIITGLVAGSYPAFFLASLKPTAALKGNYAASVDGAARVRKSLVLFQFGLSAMMIFMAIVVYQQVEFLRSKNVGFDRENVLLISPDAGFASESFKTEALRHDAVVAVGEGAAHPMEINGVGTLEWKLKGHIESAQFNGAPSDYNYLPALGFELVKGRNFSRKFASDSSAFIITEEGARILGLEDPIGQVVTYGKVGTIIGVVKDFHNADIHNPAAPVVFFLAEGEELGRWRTVFVRYKPGKQEEVVEYLEATFKKFFPNRPFVCEFMDQYFEGQFWTDRLVGKLSIAFMIVAIVLASTGLFGLALFSTQRRTREIGIRKVLGASVGQILMMLWKDFSRPIIFSLFLSIPLAWYLMNKFLDSYLFRTNISLVPLFVTIGSIVIVGFLTVSLQSLRAARANPTDALKAE